MVDRQRIGKLTKIETEDVIETCYVRKKFNLSCRGCVHRDRCELITQKYQVKTPAELYHKEIMKYEN